MTPNQRQELESQIVACTRDAKRLFEEHDETRLTRRPGEQSWSAAECLVHLNLTAAAATPLLEEAVADLRARGATTENPSRMDLMGGLLRWFLEPGRFRARTAAGFVPPPAVPFGEVLPEFRRRNDRLIEVLRSAEGLDLRTRRVTSPFDARVGYNAYAMFRVLETHERRHLRQAERAAVGEEAG